MNEVAMGLNVAVYMNIPLAQAQTTRITTIAPSVGLLGPLMRIHNAKLSIGFTC
jgi:hypothetical protein